MADSTSPKPAPRRFSSRLLQNLRPSHQHSAFSATLLLMASVMLGRVIGYLREMYVAWAFGAGLKTDAYVAAFTLPDFLFYVLAGGTASITFISIYTRKIAKGEQREAQEAFNATITIMTIVILFGTILVEILTPQFVRYWFPDFNAEQMQLCIYLTRILLPGQIFFYAGGVVSAVLFSRQMFLYPALSPVFYGSFVILGGLVGAHRFGIAALAYGALAGSFFGPFLINAIGAANAGLRYRWSLDFRNRDFREWVRLSVPLMLGVSLVSADDWIIRHFTSGGVGDMSRLNYAKRLFALPISILGQAAGQASMPFFAKLFGENRRAEFAESVNKSVYRIAAASLLATALMIPAALPLIDLAFRRGHFTFHDSLSTSVYFAWFSLSLVLWSAQALYSRGFYATGNTLTPMVASTIITALSLPIYASMFHRFGMTGLAMASDIGILMHTVVLAGLLQRKRLVPLRGLPWLELGKAFATALLAGFAGYGVSRLVPIRGSRLSDLVAIAAVGGTWLATIAAGLWMTRSELPRELRRRKAAATPNITTPAPVVDRATGGVEP